MNRLLLALIVLLPLTTACEKTIKLSSESMSPTISKGERVPIDFTSYRSDHPARWDVVLFEHPNKEVLDIKRVVGLPGESLSFTSQGLTLQGAVLVQPERISSVGYKAIGKINTKKPLTYTIPDDMYFVLGDNPGGSVDSRVFGPISRKSIVGRIMDK